MLAHWPKRVMTASLVVFAAAVHAEDLDIGKADFQSSCASCHGVDGKGKGPLANQLKVPPADLTMLAKNNNGVFPVRDVYEIIDGRTMVLAHGTHEMPIWGQRFNPVMSVPHIVDPAYDALDPSRDVREVVVRTRILAIVDYLNRIQQR